MTPPQTGIYLSFGQEPQDPSPSSPRSLELTLRAHAAEIVSLSIEKGILTLKLTARLEPGTVVEELSLPSRSLETPPTLPTTPSASETPSPPTPEVFLTTRAETPSPTLMQPLLKSEERAEEILPSRYGEPQPDIEWAGALGIYQEKEGVTISQPSLGASSATSEILEKTPPPAPLSVPPLSGREEPREEEVPKEEAPRSESAPVSFQPEGALQVGEARTPPVISPEEQQKKPLAPIQEAPPLLIEETVSQEQRITKEEVSPAKEEPLEEAKEERAEEIQEAIRERIQEEIQEETLSKREGEAPLRETEDRPVGLEEERRSEAPSRSVPTPPAIPQASEESHPVEEKAPPPLPPRSFESSLEPTRIPEKETPKETTPFLRPSPPVTTATMVRYVCPKCKTAGMQDVSKVGTIVTCRKCGKAMRLTLKR